jgi:hypothetical protein
MRQDLSTTSRARLSRRALLGCAAALSAAGGWQLLRARAAQEWAHELSQLAQKLDLVTPAMQDIGTKLASHLGPARSGLLLQALSLKLDAASPHGEQTLDQARRWVRDDFSHARVLAVHGINFSHTEAAFLIAMSGQGASS